MGGGGSLGQMSLPRGAVKTVGALVVRFDPKLDKETSCCVVTYECNWLQRATKMNVAIDVVTPSVERSRDTMSCVQGRSTTLKMKNKS